MQNASHRSTGHLTQRRGHGVHWGSDMKKPPHLRRTFLTLHLPWSSQQKTNLGQTSHPTDGKTRPNKSKELRQRHLMFPCESLNASWKDTLRVSKMIHFLYLIQRTILFSITWGRGWELQSRLLSVFGEDKIFLLLCLHIAAISWALLNTWI